MHFDTAFRFQIYFLASHFCTTHTLRLQNVQTRRKTTTKTRAHSYTTFPSHRRSSCYLPTPTSPSSLTIPFPPTFPSACCVLPCGPLLSVPKTATLYHWHQHHHTHAHCLARKEVSNHSTAISSYHGQTAALEPARTAS